MGERACALKKREIELGDNAVLNYASAELNAVISEFCEDYYTGGDESFHGDTSATWEVDKTQFKEMIDKIEKLSDQEYNEIIRGMNATQENVNKEPTRQTMLEALKALYADGIQVGNEYIYIVWV